MERVNPQSATRRPHGVDDGGDTSISAVRLMMEAEKRMEHQAETGAKFDRLPALDPVDRNPAPGVESHVTDEVDTGGTLGQKLRGFSPSWKQGAFILFVAVMLLRPWLIPGLVLLVVWIGLIAYFTIGPERISELVQTVWERYELRFPNRAKRSLALIQRTADRFDGWLARLPESWTDGVYLPDFGRSGVIGADTGPDPFDRLSAEREALLGHPDRA